MKKNILKILMTVALISTKTIKTNWFYNSYIKLRNFFNKTKQQQKKINKSSVNVTSSTLKLLKQKLQKELLMLGNIKTRINKFLKNHFSSQNQQQIQQIQRMKANGKKLLQSIKNKQNEIGQLKLQIQQKVNLNNINNQQLQNFQKNIEKIKDSIITMQQEELKLLKSRAFRQILQHQNDQRLKQEIQNLKIKIQNLINTNNYIKNDQLKQIENSIKKLEETNKTHDNYQLTTINKTKLKSFKQKLQKELLMLGNIKTRINKFLKNHFASQNQQQTQQIQRMKSNGKKLLQSIKNKQNEIGQLKLQIQHKINLNNINNQQLQNLQKNIEKIKNSIITMQQEELKLLKSRAFRQILQHQNDQRLKQEIQNLKIKIQNLINTNNYIKNDQLKQIEKSIEKLEKIRKGVKIRPAKQNEIANAINAYEQCSICFDNPKTRVILKPCNHASLCLECTKGIIKTRPTHVRNYYGNNLPGTVQVGASKPKCPICRTDIAEVVTIPK